MSFYGISDNPVGVGAAPSATLPPPPRSVRPWWQSIAGPNFQYFLHVMVFTLWPLLAFVWLTFVFAWAGFGTIVAGRFSYALIVDAGAAPRDQMQVEYRFEGERRMVSASLSPAQLRQLGMSDQMHVVSGKPLVEADVPVRVLRVGQSLWAVPVFAWTWVWKQLIPPAVLLAITAAALLILHGELFATIRLSYQLVKGGMAVEGQVVGTHETGWWEPSGEYAWTYIRRVYVDYTFVAPDGHERRGCQLVLGAADPAQMAEGSRITALYDTKDSQRHIMYQACAFRARRA